ncbi:MAG: allophanate hydrolase-related protein [Sulfurovum sp.]
MKENEILVGVCGAHMEELPLNWQLTDLDAKLVQKTRTKKGYRLFVLENKDPIRPGMIYDSTSDTQIELEVWSMPVENFGKFMKQIASPLAIGTVYLEDESGVYGFVCEADFIKDAKEISDLKSWRNFIA